MFVSNNTFQWPHSQKYNSVINNHDLIWRATGWASTECVEETQLLRHFKLFEEAHKSAPKFWSNKYILALIRFTWHPHKLSKKCINTSYNKAWKRWRGQVWGKKPSSKDVRKKKGELRGRNEGYRLGMIKEPYQSYVSTFFVMFVIFWYTIFRLGFGIRAGLVWEIFCHKSWTSC